MKRSFKLLLCIIAIVALMVGCELPTANEDTHGHAFVDTNGDNICDTCNTDGTATHGHAFVDANNDNVCDTCNNDGAATHGHTFVDSNRDNVCDTCAAAAHVHTYDSAWSYNDTKHWHAANCGHNSLKKDEASHTLNDFGICTVCENQISAPDLSTIDKALAIADAMKGLVENGKIIDNDEYSYNEVIDYLFANGYFYTKVTNDYFGAETWYSTDANGNIFAIERNSDGEVRRLTAYDNISLDNLGGYMFNCPLAEETFFYGVEDLIAGLWALGKDDFNGDLVSSVDDGVFAFSYGYFFDDVFFIVDVAFELSDEYYIDSADVSIVAYYEYNVIPGATDEDEPTYEIAEEATAYGRMNYSFEQNVVATNPYPADEILANSFKVVDADGVEIGNALNVEKGANLYLYLADVLPETAILNLIQVAAIGDAVDNWDVYIRASEDDYGNWAIVVTGYTIGSFEVTLAVNGVETDVIINVAEAVPTEVEVSVYEEIEETDWFGDPYTILSPFVADSSYIVWAGSAPIILGAAANKGDNTDCVVTVNGVEATLVEKETTEGWVYVLEFEPDEAGVYEIVFTAEADETLTETVTVTVKAPDTEELLSGKYIYTEDGVNIWEIVFGWGNTLSVNYREHNSENKVWKLYSAEYTYKWENNQLETTLVNGYDFTEKIIINEETDYNFVIDGNALVKETSASALVGKYIHDVFDYSTWEKVGEYVLTFNADGTGVFEAKDVKIYFTYVLGEFDADTETYAITLSANDNETNVGETTAFGLDAVVSYSYYPDAAYFTVSNGEIDENDSLIAYGYTKVEIATEEYEWPQELSTMYPTNIWNETDDAAQIELLINAVPGKYVIYVCYWGETTPITALNEYSFVINGVNVVGALIFEVDEEQRMIITMNVPAIYDYEIHVEYTEVEKEEEEEEEDGAALTVTTDIQQSSNQGEYTYTIDDDGNITIYKDGVVADISSAYSLHFEDGVLTVLYGTDYAKVMVKYEGEDGVLEGSWKYATEFMTMYDFTFAAPATNNDGDDDGAVSEPTGLEGTYNMVDKWGNEVVVTIDGTTIRFVPAGSADGEAIVYNYTYENGIASYTDTLGVAVTMPMQFSLSITDGEVVGMTYNGTGYNVAA